MAKTKTQKKYVLASYTNVYDSMEDLTAALVRLIESGSAIQDLVIGTYVGIPELSTNIAVNVGGRVKRMNKSSIKLEMRQPPPDRPAVAPAPEPVEAPIMEDISSEENDGVCSFCGEKWVKKTVMEGFDTFLCKFHLQLESQLATL